MKNTPATKSDLDAVKTELKADIARLDQKTDRIAVRLVNVESELKEMRHDMATKEDIGNVLSAIDAFVQKNERFDRKVVLHDHRINEHEETLKDHDVRITSLESRKP